MRNGAAPIARVRLARSVWRLLVFPALLVLAGAAIAAYGGFATPMPAAVALAATGTGLVVTGLAWAAWVLTVTLDVEEAAIRVHWLGGGRRYPLVAGPVTRVRFRGESASRLRARTGLFGWQLGEARLRDEEEVHVVRLAPTESAILVPTEKGRLAIAPADEAELLDALTRAARARQRLAESAATSSLDEVQAPAVEAPAPEREPEPEPHVLTGIERALLEQQLADERAAAEAAAARGELPPQHAEPREAPTREPALAATPPAPPAPLPAPTAVRRRAITLPRVRLRGLVRRPGARATAVLLPLVAAGVAWGAGLVTGNMPAGDSDLGRLTALALMLAGPATSIGVVMALAWWPRIAGVVVAGGLAASVFIGRALVGV